MSDKSAASDTLSNTPDTLLETGDKLENVRRRLAEDMEGKKIEFERFKEETLWRLNAMSDRTIEIARMEEKDVEERLAQDREEAEAAFADWKTRLRERLWDEKFLDVLAKDAFDGLLPFFESADTLGEGGDSA
ncbi:MAG: hypothetical protein LBP21_00275 [Synergistaceae bacterium]|jgi:predicted phage-related endonuclease|nr:hypothetical protein [Synergistaceae bacterium]